LETAHNVTSVIFDKTGTLTYGKPQVTNIAFRQKNGVSYSNEKIEEFLGLVASAESCSQHPIAKSIVAYVKNFRHINVLPPYDSVESAGQVDLLFLFIIKYVRLVLISNIQGVRCTANGITVVVGNRAWMAQNSITVDTEIAREMSILEDEARTVVLVAIDSKFIGYIAVSDEIKVMVLA